MVSDNAAVSPISAAGLETCVLFRAARARSPCRSARIIYRYERRRIQNPIDQLRRAAHLEKQGKFAEAIELCQKSLNLQPHNAHALHLLGVLQFRCKQVDLAVNLIHQAIEKKGDVADFHNSLGIALAASGDRKSAIKAFRRAVQIRPIYSEAWSNLSAALEQQGEFNEALTAIDDAIANRHSDAKAHHRRGVLLGKLGGWKQAAQAHRNALALGMPLEQVIEHLVVALERSRQPVEALVWARRLVQIAPGAPACHCLGRALLEAGQYSEANTYLQRSISFDPACASVHQNLGLSYWRQCRLDYAVTSYRKAVELAPNDGRAASDLIFAMLHDSNTTHQSMLEQCRRWASHKETHSYPAHRNDRDPDRRLRVGYVSGDFRDHTIARVIGPVLKSHDRKQIEVFCYSSVQEPDRTTTRLKGLSDYWREITFKSEAQIAEIVLSDKIDILVDLTGHMGGNHLGLFAMKPAPIQVQLAYAGTTGLTAMDYRITDAHGDPPGMSESYYTERLLYQPTAWVYEPDPICPDVNPLPALQAGFVTFCSPNRTIKITDQAMELWAKILHALPRSKLTVLAEARGEENQHLLQRFSDRGIDESRLNLVPRLSRPNYMVHFNRVDIVLDTFPYNGDTTTCDAMWMGVPVVTLEGNAFHSRRGGGLLSCMDLHELIAHSPESYVQIAIELAKDLPRLVQLRSTLRDRLAKSSVTDGLTYTRQLECNYRQIWHKWCKSSDAEEKAITTSQSDQRSGDKAKASVEHSKNSLCILFAHHRNDVVTRHHLQVLQQHNPTDPIVLLCNESVHPLPGAIDVSQLSNEFLGENRWLGSDAMLYLWFRHCRNIDAERYAIIEWDTLATMPLRDYYLDVWDADAAGSELKTPQNTPDWEWFSECGSRLPEALRPHMAGLVPFNGILLSHRALDRICSQEIPKHVNNELRLGTLLNACGFEMKAIDRTTSLTNRWRADQITVTGKPGLYHPVKAVLPDLAGTSKVIRFHAESGDA